MRTRRRRIRLAPGAGGPSPGARSSPRTRRESRRSGGRRHSPGPRPRRRRRRSGRSARHRAGTAFDSTVPSGPMRFTRYSRFATLSPSWVTTHRAPSPSASERISPWSSTSSRTRPDASMRTTCERHLEAGAVAVVRRERDVLTRLQQRSAHVPEVGRERDRLRAEPRIAEVARRPRCLESSAPRRVRCRRRP